MSEPRRVALVTGASAGIGKAAAERLEADGVTVVRVGRRYDDAAVSRRCDVTREADVRRAVDGAVAAWGRIDILVNSAGVAAVADPLSLTVDDWDAMFHTNVVGTYLMCKHVIPVMQRQGGGRVVNLGSVAGRTFSRTASVAYTASKYAVIGLTRQLAAAFAGDGVRINCVAPSQTRTEMLEAIATTEQLAAIAAANPTGRLAEPGEVAEVIRFLAGEGASYMNGAVVDVNGGVC